MPPQVTIIVVTYNSRSCFARLEAALAAQTAPFHLIVHDNASAPDQRPTLADFPNAKIRQCVRNLGFAGGNNDAAAEVVTPFIALLNPDAYPDSDWVRRLLAAAERYPRAGAFGSTQIMTNDGSIYDGLGDCYFAAGASWRGGHGMTHAGTLSDASVFSACAAAALYRTEAWRAVGGFDARYFTYNEDIDLCFRLRLRGWQIAQVANAVVHHEGSGGSQASTAFVTYHVMRNRIWTFVKNTPSWLFWVLLPAHAALTVYQCFGAAMNGQGRAAAAGVSAALSRLNEVWRDRTYIQTTSTVGVCEIASAMTWSPLKMARRAPDLRSPPR